MIRTSSRALLLACILGAVGSAAANDFSIESKVFDGRELVAAGTTLFAEGRAYDFLVRPDETIILSLDDGKITLLDNTRKLRAEITAETVANFTEELRRKAERSDSEAMRFYAAPEFREQLDPETGEVVLSSPWMEYRAKPLVPPGAEVLRRYEKYVQLQTRLNTLVNPGSPPSGPREALNAALARRQVLAEQVSLRRTTLVSGGGKSLRAEHHFTWRLGEPDQRRIAEAEQRLTAYRLVSFTDYVRPTK